jgi:glucose-6-phosphate isomerase
MTAEAVGIYFDYSKHRITDETVKLLLHLAEESGLRGRIEAMFRGEKINVTEKRAVLLHPGAQRGVEGLHRQADPHRHQYRHRRV